MQMMRHYMEILREAESADAMKYWFNVRTGQVIVVPRNAYHHDMVEDDPEDYGVDGDILKQYEDTHIDPATPELALRLAMQNGWVRANKSGADGVNFPFVHAGSLADAQAALKWMIAHEFIGANGVEIEITDSLDLAKEGVFHSLDDEQIDRFLRRRA